ncbi:sorbitol phosphotransferase enzyme II component [Alkalibaculum bacchi]|jgi:sorbitol-specific phosphotransferase system component IIBC|uniref:Sorbitol phosphotransferase enzyme II component n=1 Tax=Alkalibaculum bacchi TaxID=645887 RepID=A0A366I9Y6_9FIRM|nr:hypothetical protein [Alkalibaculum bacchi]RBP65354.1 sorbitol phosphotransferase enzyme II component [Alkalibaculum bacchi]
MSLADGDTVITETASAPKEEAKVAPKSNPVGLSLGDAEPETVEIGVPAILFSRVITGPASVVIAYFASFGLF